jgi:hypothetical protein
MESVTAEPSRWYYRVDGSKVARDSGSLLMVCRQIRSEAKAFLDFSLAPQ